MPRAVLSGSPPTGASVATIVRVRPVGLGGYDPRVHLGDLRQQRVGLAHVARHTLAGRLRKVVELRRKPVECPCYLIASLPDDAACRRARWVSGEIAPR